MQWAHGEGYDFTLIETMPLGEIDEDRTDQYLPLSLVRQRLEEKYNLLPIPYKTGGPARYVEVTETGGRLGFTDLVAGPALEEGDRAALEASMEMRTLQTVPEYMSKFRAAGLSLVSHDDLSPQWVAILTERLEWYRAMDAGTRQTLGDGVHERYMDGYETFVGLVQAGRLGGGRFVLRKD